MRAVLFLALIVNVLGQTGPTDEDALSSLINVVKDYQSKNEPLDEQLFFDKLSALLTKSNVQDPDAAHINQEISNLRDIVFGILQWKEVVKPSDDPLPYMEHKSLELIADDVRKSLHKELIDAECPYSYNRAGKLCLSVDLTATGLTWQEARSHCQTTKRGDLAIFKDADDFESILDFVRKLKFEGVDDTDYWIGARDTGKQGWFTFINGELTPQGTPFWSIVEEKQSPSNHEEFAFLDHEHLYLLNSQDEPSDSGTPNILPLCMYYPNLYDAYLMRGYSYQGQDILKDLGASSFSSLYPNK